MTLSTSADWNGNQAGPVHEGTYATLPKIIRTQTNTRSSVLVFTSPKCLLLILSHSHTHTRMHMKACRLIIRYVCAEIYKVSVYWFFIEPLTDINRLSGLRFPLFFFLSRSFSRHDLLVIMMKRGAKQQQNKTKWHLTPSKQHYNNTNMYLHSSKKYQNYNVSKQLNSTKHS